MPIRYDYGLAPPGQGCGCVLCRQPLPDIAPLTRTENARRRAAWEAWWRGEGPRPDPAPIPA